jgi:diketogulonate reductase-like aldo/keto reductase
MEAITLNNGIEIPALGFGVFQTPPDETRDAVGSALGAGYRHIDTAAAYGNERQVGEAVHSSDVERSEVILETKIWISDYGYDETLHGFEKSAHKLGVDQIDLLICTSRCPRRSTGPWRPTALWRACSPTAGSARSGSATSWSNT